MEVATARGVPRPPRMLVPWAPLLAKTTVPLRPGMVAQLLATVQRAVTMAEAAAAVTARLRYSLTELGPALAAAAATTAAAKPQLARWRPSLRRASVAASVAAHLGQMTTLALPLRLLLLVFRWRQWRLQRRQLLLRVLRHQRPTRAAPSGVACQLLLARGPRSRQMVVCLCPLCLLQNLILRLLLSPLAFPVSLIAATRCIVLIRAGSAWILLPILPA